jgi:hypothetical protein
MFRCRIKDDSMVSGARCGYNIDTFSSVYGLSLFALVEKWLTGYR